jgi:hypothetical protein
MGWFIHFLLFIFMGSRWLQLNNPTNWVHIQSCIESSNNCDELNNIQVCCNHQLLGLYICPSDSNFLLWFTLWLPSHSVFPHLFFFWVGNFWIAVSSRLLQLWPESYPIWLLLTSNRVRFLMQLAHSWLCFYWFQLVRFAEMYYGTVKPCPFVLGKAPGEPVRAS